VAEPVSTNWRGEQDNALSLRRDFPSPTDARHLVFKNFEIASIRVTERRFAAKDMIFSPVGPDEKIGTKAQQPYAAV
jgi:hypothetical protein